MLKKEAATASIRPEGAAITRMAMRHVNEAVVLLTAKVRKSRNVTAATRKRAPIRRRGLKRSLFTVSGKGGCLLHSTARGKRWRLALDRGACRYVVTWHGLGFRLPQHLTHASQVRDQPLVPAVALLGVD